MVDQLLLHMGSPFGGPLGWFLPASMNTVNVKRGQVPETLTSILHCHQFVVHIASSDSRFIFI